MRCLVVLAHPLADSLAAELARTARSCLETLGHDVDLEDLYGEEFLPALSLRERATYYEAHYDSAQVERSVTRLRAAEGLVLVFPTWWFGPPAILKGWFDRVWAPGIAYDHAADLGVIKPRLHGLRRTLAVTTLGSPWWVDRLVLRAPVKQVLKRAILATCAPRSTFEMLSLYRSEKLAPEKVEAFANRIRRALRRW